MHVGVVGAGLAGLATAHAFEHAGHTVEVFESTNRVGGRMNTIMVEGYPLDVGFHVLHTAYPTVQRWINIHQLQAKSMAKCSIFIQPSKGKTSTLGDGISSPKFILPSLKSVGVIDGIRFLSWRIKSKKHNLESNAMYDKKEIYEFLHDQKFSKNTKIKLKTLFSGITLDPSLSNHADFAQFTWSAMAHGEMILPKNGIRAVPEQIHKKLQHTQVHFNTSVVSLTPQSITTSQQTHNFDAVILATPQHVTNRLLGRSTSPPLDNFRTKVFCFSSSNPPFRTPALMISEEWKENCGEVLHVNVPTLLHAHPHGLHLICATVIGNDVETTTPETIRSSLENWFGKSVEDWQFLTSTQVEYALPTKNESYRQGMQTDQSVYVVGDHCIHGSVQGTLESVERLLSEFQISIPGVE